MRLVYQKLFPDALPPTRAHPTDAGWDIRSRERVLIRPGERVTISTGLIVALFPRPDEQGFMPLNFKLDKRDWASWYLRVADKSGIAARLGLHVMGGVIDRNYRGELKIVMVGLGLMDAVMAELPAGSKICQIIPTLVPVVEDAHESSDLLGVPTDRGDGGFGSTGVV